MLRMHRQNAVTAPRKTAKSYDAHLQVLAYLDAERDMKREASCSPRFGKAPLLACAASCGDMACKDGCKLLDY